MTQKNLIFSNVFPDTSLILSPMSSIELWEFKCIGIVNVIIDEYFQRDYRVMKVELLNEVASHGMFLLLFLLYINEACGNCSPFYSEIYKWNFFFK